MDINITLTEDEASIISDYLLGAFEDENVSADDKGVIASAYKKLNGTDIEDEQ